MMRPAPCRVIRCAARLSQHKRPRAAVAVQREVDAVWVAARWRLISATPNEPARSAHAVAYAPGVRRLHIIRRHIERHGQAAMCGVFGGRDGHAIGGAMPAMVAQMSGDMMAGIRAEILAQPEAERLDFALDVLRFYIDPLPEFVQACAQLGLRLCAFDLCVLNALDRRRGEVVSMYALHAAAGGADAADGVADFRTMHKNIHRIRTRLNACRVPVQILSAWGHGFRLLAAPTFRFAPAIVASGAHHGAI
jgi:hypothetical protein